MRRHLAICLLSIAAAACSSSSSTGAPTADEPLQSTAGPNTDEADPNEAPTTDRCLPVVAAECGCVYECGAGELQPDGRYHVSHSFWSGGMTARVDEWCADGQCTTAFFGEIVCDGICAPRPADPTCHFAGSACVSGRPGDD